jgi:hypothetical protein
MIASLTLVSENDLVLGLVGDFARGLGCVVDAASPGGRRIRIGMPDGDDILIELLTHVALSAAKAGIEPSEPLCYLTCRHGSVSSEVTLGLRIEEFAIHSKTPSGV